MRLLLVLLMLWPSWGGAIDSWTMADIRQVESLRGVYLVHSPRRHDSERVQQRKGTVKVDIWTGSCDVQSRNQDACR